MKLAKLTLSRHHFQLLACSGRQLFEVRSPHDVEELIRTWVTEALVETTTLSLSEHTDRDVRPAIERVTVLPRDVSRGF